MPTPPTAANVSASDLATPSNGAPDSERGVNTILINDQPRDIASGLTVEELVRDLGFAGRKGVAIAINDEVVPRASWTTRRLASNERVLIIRATQGG